MFTLKDGYKLEFQGPETKLLGITKKLIDSRRNGENVLSFQVVQVVLVQCNLADNQNQEKSEVLHTFNLNRLYSYVLNVELRHLDFLKTYNTEFDDIITIFWIKILYCNI